MPPCTLFMVGCPYTRTAAQAVLLCIRSQLQRPEHAVAELHSAGDVLHLISGKEFTVLMGPLSGLTGRKTNMIRVMLATVTANRRHMVGLASCVRVDHTLVELHWLQRTGEN